MQKLKTLLTIYNLDLISFGHLVIFFKWTYFVNTLLMNGRALLVIYAPPKSISDLQGNESWRWQSWWGVAKEKDVHRWFWLELQIDSEVQSGMCRQHIMLNDNDLPENPDRRSLKAESVFHASMSSFRSTKPNSSLFLSLAEPRCVFCWSIFLRTRLFWFACVLGGVGGSFFLFFCRDVCLLCTSEPKSS